MAEDNKGKGKTTVDHAANLAAAMQDIAAKRDAFVAQMKTGDMAAARAANSADNDFKNLERIAKRYASGAYK